MAPVLRGEIVRSVLAGTLRNCSDLQNQSLCRFCARRKYGTFVTRDGFLGERIHSALGMGVARSDSWAKTMIALTLFSSVKGKKVKSIWMMVPSLRS